MGRVWEGFWGAKILDFRTLFRHFFIAKFRMQFGRAKHRKKMLSKTIRHFFEAGSAVCAALGGRKKDGGKATWHELGKNSWPEILTMLLSNAFLDLGPSIWHARHSLREAADVLRTYRRAAGGNEKPK